MSLYLGIDVQTERGCAYAVVDDNLVSIRTGWLHPGTERPVIDSFHPVLDVITSNGQSQIIAGIDAPRKPLNARREYYWDGKHNRWRNRRADERGRGRHCEVVIAAYRLANPQWTPLARDAPSWMRVGFALYEALKKRGVVYEVFPSASYSLLQGREQPRINVELSNFSHGPKDMLDAYVAAATVFEFVNGRGCEVGGGDGLGAIILPARLPEAGPTSVLAWPG